jgi:hypothetical protein
MSDEGLTAPKQVEYVILQPRRKRVRLRIVGLALIFGAVVGVALLVVHLRSAPHVYKPIDLPAIGLTASLRTKWVNGEVRYIFQVKPVEGTESRFASVVQSVPHEQLHFDIHLLDSDGFELCSGSPTVHTTIGSDGRAVGMRGDDALTKCSEEQMRAASRWHVTYRFPLLTTDLDPTPPRAITNGLIQSQLTGKDFTTGEIETLDQGSFKVVRKAEYETLVGWEPPDIVSLSCKQKACVLTNLRTQESVHAEKR